jgi:hypothetical protein
MSSLSADSIALFSLSSLFPAMAALTRFLIKYDNPALRNPKADVASNPYIMTLLVPVESFLWSEPLVASLVPGKVNKPRVM